MDFIIANVIANATEAKSTIGQGRKTTPFPRKESFGLITRRQSSDIVTGIGGGGRQRSSQGATTRTQRDDLAFAMFGEDKVKIELLSEPYKARARAVGLDKNATLGQVKEKEEQRAEFERKDAEKKKRIADKLAEEEKAAAEKAASEEAEPAEPAEPAAAPAPAAAEEEKSPWQQLLIYLLQLLTGRQENFSEGKEKREVFFRIISSIIHLIIYYYALKIALKCTKNISDITKQTRQVLLRLLFAPLYLIIYFIGGNKC